MLARKIELIFRPFVLNDCIKSSPIRKHECVDFSRLFRHNLSCKLNLVT